MLSRPPLGSPALCCDTAQHPERGFPTFTWTSPRSSHSSRLSNERAVQPGSYQSILRWRVGPCNYTRGCKKNCKAARFEMADISSWISALIRAVITLTLKLGYAWNSILKCPSHLILSSSLSLIYSNPDDTAFYPWILCFYSVILQHLEGRGSCSTLDLQLFSTQGWHIRNKYVLNEWKYPTFKEKQMFHCYL